MTTTVTLPPNKWVKQEVEIHNVNFRPHCYMVGTEHVAYASEHCNGILDERTTNVIPCARRGCNLSYDEHEYDTVAVVEIVKKDDAIGKFLQDNLSLFKEHNIDGFAFIDATGEE